MIDYSTCKACKAKIGWILTENGKKCPLDAEPEKRWVYTKNGTWKMVDTYQSHFSTCPSEDLFREKT